MTTTTPALVRFVPKIERDDLTGCWLWGGSTYPNGYGQFWTGATVTPAHRVSHELFIGPIPSAHEVDHLCRVITCVNPDHLEAVTRLENARRRVAATGLADFCRRGHALTRDDTEGKGKGKRGCRICGRASRGATGEGRRISPTHCPGGHPKIPENRNDYGACLVCMRERARVKAARLRAERIAS